MIKVHCTDCPYEGTTTDPDESGICPTCGQECVLETKMKSTKTLAICDLNAAVASLGSKDYTSKCLMAQFASRITGKTVVGSTSDAAAFVDDNQSEPYPFRVRGMEHLVHLFDNEQAKNSIAEIRRHLPLEVEVEIL